MKEHFEKSTKQSTDKISSYKWISFVLVFVLISGLLILPSHSTQAQPNSPEPVTPSVINDITWYKGKAIFASEGAYSHWMIADNVDNAWQITHSERIPTYYSEEEKEKRISFFETLSTRRLHTHNDTLYVLATNEYYPISGLTNKAARIYRYNLSTLSYIDTIDLQNKYEILDFVLTDTEEIIVLTSEGLYTFKDDTYALIRSLDTSYNELQWMDETTLCIGGYPNYLDPQTSLLQYELDTQKLSTLYEGKLPIHDIAVAKDHSIYAVATDTETELCQLYCYPAGTFSLFDPVQRLSSWTQVLMNEDGCTAITLSEYWSNPIVYTKVTDSVIRRPMLFTKPGGLTLQYPTCLHAAAGETSVLVNKGICIYEDVNPQEFSSQWKDTGLTIPYETCTNIMKVDEQAYLALESGELCLIDSTGYHFFSNHALKIFTFQREYYVLANESANNTNEWNWKKINLEDCTISSSPIVNIPKGPITVYENYMYIYKDETILKGTIQDNSFVEQEVLPAPAFYWDEFKCSQLFYNPLNETFTLIDDTHAGFKATFLKHSADNRPISVGFIEYAYVAQPYKGKTGVYNIVLLNGHVSFITHEGYGRLLQF